MKRTHTEVLVPELPKCDFCSKKARYDARTVMGPWANLCQEHYSLYGIRLGLGCGQRLIPMKGEA